MKKYTCVLFDLDHTLWDFEKNAEETLRVLFQQYDLEGEGVPSFATFYEAFVRINTELWDLHDRHLIGSDHIRLHRFSKVLGAVGVDDYPMSLKFSSDFLAALPKKKNLMPHAAETLAYLHPKYPMVVVTNGFDELQTTKMISSGIRHYFKTIVTSQRAGSRKPSKEIFEFALREAGHSPRETVMIGDNLQTDIAGARAAGIDTIYFNPAGHKHGEDVTYEIKSLGEIQMHL